MLFCIISRGPLCTSVCRLLCVLQVPYYAPGPVCGRVHLRGAGSGDRRDAVPGLLHSEGAPEVVQNQDHVLQGTETHSQHNTSTRDSFLGKNHNPSPLAGQKNLYSFVPRSTRAPKAHGIAMKGKGQQFDT